MAKGRKVNIIDMQMRILRDFDRDVRQSGGKTSGLLRNLPVGQWGSTSSTVGTPRLSSIDRKIAAVKAELNRYQ